MIVYISFLIMIVLVIFYNYNNYKKPNIKKLFKEEDKYTRISLSYAVLFNVDDLAKSIYMRFNQKCDEKIIIKGYNCEVFFYNKMRGEEIKSKLLSFQDQLFEKVYFENMYYKTSYDIILELWLKYSNNKNYRKIFCKIVNNMYCRGEIYRDERNGALLKFYDIV